jgi:TRAP-type C4-dicarboxylate transport system permease small subunit
MSHSLSAWVNHRYNEIGPIKWLAFLLELIAATTLLFVMLITCADVVGRYLFNNSIDGVTELTEIGLAVMIFAEMPIITWRGGHVVVDILDRLLGVMAVKVLGLIAALVIATSFYGVGLRIFELAERALRRGVVTEYLGMPTGYIIQYIAVMSWFTALGVITYGVYRQLKGQNSSL